MSTTNPALVIELDGKTWDAYLGRVGPWLATTATLQSTFRKMAEDALADVTNATVRGYLEGIVGSAREHEKQIPDLYRAFGLEPAGVGLMSSVASTVVNKTREMAGHVEGIASSARGGGWRLLRELLITNLDAISGYGVAEQLALALGLPEPVGIIVPILKIKTEHQLQLKESFLEFAPLAILYHNDL